MLPLGDDTRQPARYPAVTVAIVAVNAIVFVLELLGGDSFVLRWSAIPADITAGRHLETLLTSVFMHGSWSHIIGNMIFLWAFGPEIEDAMGPRHYLIFYLIAGVVSMGAQIAANAQATVPNLGASGAIAAVMGAFLVTYPRDRIRTVIFFGIFFGITFIPAALLIGLWIVIQLLNLGAVAQTESGGVAYLAHVGGAIFGALLGPVFEKHSTPPRKR